MTATLTALVLSLGTAHAAGPCGNLRLTGTAVQTDLVLPVTSSLTGEAQACVAELGKQLAQRAGLRTVTVAVRVGDAERADGSGRAVGTSYASALSAAGIPSSRVSVVVPALSTGQTSAVAITYAERSVGPDVAVIDTVSGTVGVGASPSELTAAAAGTRLPARRFVKTGAGSSALVGLADGSWIRVGADSLVLVGDLYVDGKQQRVVKLEVLQGKVDANIAQTGGSFKIATPAGVAGVRGTEFRVDAGSTEGASTKIETTEGSVGLAGGAGEQVVLDGGFGSQVAVGAPPDPARKLLKAPAVEGPYKGRRKGEDLSWKGVSKAGDYVVELARDAEFLVDAQQTRLADRALAPSIEEGTWFWRVAAVDEDGFVGMWSKTYSFDEGYRP